MSAALRSMAVLSFVSLAFMLVPACGGGGAAGPADNSDQDLVVVQFALVDQASQPTGATSTTNAYRNNRLMFTFSAPVDATTVSDRTIQIGLPAGANLFSNAPGKFTVDGNRVVFDPTVTDTGAPRPFGFEPGAVYSVTVFAYPDPKTVQSTVGNVVASTFTTSFTTTDLYLPDLDQPRLEGFDPPGLSPTDLAHLEALTPTERKDENDATQQWENLPWVSSRGDIKLTFSEAVHPDTFDPTTSFRVVNMDRKDRDVLGVYLFSDDAKTVTFRPTFGFGRGPFLIRVEVTSDITDLAGNPISNPGQWVFLTEYDQFAVNEGLIEEPFDTNTHEDTAFTPTGTGGLAQWNPASEPGKLVSVFGTTSIITPFPYSQGNSSNSFPFGGTGALRVQNWMTAAEIGNAGTITGLSWWPAGSVGGGGVMSNLITTIGHNSSTKGLASTTWTANFDVGNPVTVLNGVSYTLPTMTAGQPCQFPTLQTTFWFNGTNSLVIDNGKASLSGSSTSWRNKSDISGRRAYNNSSQSSATATAIDSYAYTYTIDFRTETSMARSLFFRTESDYPEYLDPIVNPTEQPTGTETLIQYQGAHEVEDPVTHELVPDLSTLSAWTEDPTDLFEHRYVRFQVTFKANLGTGVGPKIEDILIPYLFFD